MSTKKTVLATGPHPDDYEFGCSGTLLRHKKRGDKVYALILTYGHCTDKCLMKTRKIESIKAAEILGLDDIFFAELPFSDIRTSHNHVAKVEKYIKQLNPDVVYAISPNDWHPDHEHGGKIIRSAARGVQNVLYYAGSTNTVFNPGIYVDITDFMDKKIAAIIKHESQLNENHFDEDSIKGQASYFANRLFRKFRNIKYAEAFEAAQIISPMGPVTNPLNYLDC